MAQKPRTTKASRALHMRPIETDELCCKTIRNVQGWSGFKLVQTRPCGRTATHTNGSHLFCRRHAGVGTYVVRDGEIGEIIERFDTEEQLRENMHLYPGMNFQRVTKSNRKTIYPK